MTRFLEWLLKGTREFLAEFFGQIIAAIILFLGFVAWAYFSTIYAAIPVVVVGLLIWGAAGKLFASGKHTDE